MRSFWIGLIVGGLFGAGATYAALEKPWQRGAEEVKAPAVEPDAGLEPKKAHKKRRKGKRRDRGEQEGVVDEIVELSAADRAMVWKGQAVRLPPKEVDFGGGAGGRSLDQGEIDAGISTGSARIAECIGSARGNAELSATIELKMLVGPDGRVLARRVRAPAYLQRNGLFACVSKATARMKFASVGGHTVVSVPFDLR